MTYIHRIRHFCICVCYISLLRKGMKNRIGRVQRETGKLDRETKSETGLWVRGEKKVRREG